MAEDSKRPTHRMIAKLTDSRQERFENVGVAWAKVRDDGQRMISIRLSRFVDGAKLAQAESLLLVPFEQQGQAQGASGGQRKAGAAVGTANAPGGDPGPSDDPGPDDDDIPF